MRKYRKRGVILPRFFVNGSAVSDGYVKISGDDAFHIARSLRMRTGETVTVCDDGMKEYSCRLEKITDDEVVALILAEGQSMSEPPYEAVLYQALCKGDKFDTVVQKAVETGAKRIVPVLTARCTVRPDKKSLDAKQARWSRIAAEASKQSGRGIVVTVSPCMTFREAVSEAAKADVPLFCYEDERTVTLPSLLDGKPGAKTVSVFVGPEGGFDSAEAEAAERAGLRSCSLGRRILRTETASSFVLACLSYKYELQLP